MLVLTEVMFALFAAARDPSEVVEGVQTLHARKRACGLGACRRSVEHSMELHRLLSC
jgi:hypothetical protein